MDNKQLIAMVLGIAAVGAVPKAVSAGQESYFSELWGEKGERWDPLGRLPDFSYAGYHTGEKPIPDVPVRGNVKDFGAKGDGEADDTQAFKDAIAASEGGAILIPAGRYVISDFLRIKRSNLVLRGAGRDKTTLFFPKTIKELQGEVGYYDGLIRPEGDNKGAQLTDVAEGAKRGDTTLAVKSTAGIRSGQMIRLRMYNPISGEAPEYIDLPATIRNRVKATDPTYNSFGKYIYGDGSYGLNPERRGWFGGADVDWVVKVESVRGNTIKLARPLRLDVRLEWKPEIWSHAPTLQEVGFEDFGIEFPDIQYNGHQQGQGCHAFYVLGAYNCWFRRIRLVDADECFILMGARHTTVSDVVMVAKYRTEEPNTQATGFYAVVLGGLAQDNLVTGCDLQTSFCLNLNVNALANGNVYSSIRTLYPRFDHHACAPYENLYTDIVLTKGGEGFHRSGGGRADEPQSGVRDTYWNIRKLAGTWTVIQGPDAHPQMNIIGMDGLKTAKPPADSLDTWIESWPGEQTRPANLYLAQLARRLGRTPQ